MVENAFTPIAHFDIYYLYFVFTIHIVSTFNALTFNVQCIPELLTWNLENVLWIMDKSKQTAAVNHKHFPIFHFTFLSFLMTLMNLIFLLFLIINSWYFLCCECVNDYGLGSLFDINGSNSTILLTNQCE